MRAKFDSKLVKQIAQAYDWGIKPKYNFNGRIAHARSPGWRFPGMALMLALTKNLTQKDLQKIEAHFKKHPERRAFDVNTPYVQWLDTSYYDREANTNLLEENGWEKQPDKDAVYLNIWKRLTPVKIPKGFEIDIGGFDNEKLKKQFTDLMRVNFGITSVFIKEIDYFMKFAKTPMNIVVISHRGKPVATGAVSTNGNASYLFSGCVSKAYRSKGLWKLLLATRQTISYTGPGHVWMLTSKTPHIMRSGELSAKIQLFTKLRERPTRAEL